MKGGCIMEWTGSKHYNRAQRLLKKNGNRVYTLKDISDGIVFESAFNANAKEAKESCAKSWNNVKFENLRVMRSHVMTRDEIIYHSEID
jgi:hypothetical protein